jgi:hypothetical protein
MARMRTILFPKNESQARTCNVFTVIERRNRSACSDGGDLREGRCHVWAELRFGRLGVERGRLVGYS